MFSWYVARHFMDNVVLRQHVDKSPVFTGQEEVLGALDESPKLRMSVWDSLHFFIVFQLHQFSNV